MENGHKTKTIIDNDESVPIEKKRNKPNLISRLFICWICPVLIKGNRRDVEEEDLIVPTKQYDSERLGDKLEQYWHDEYNLAKAENRDPSLWKAMRRAYWLTFMPGAFYVIVIAIGRTCQPLLFARLLSFWATDDAMDRAEAGYYALGMLGINFITMLCQHHNNLFVMRFSLKMKVACSALLYRKVLKLSQTSLGDVAAGKIVNLLANDVARFDYAFMFLHYLWVVPIQVAVVLYLINAAAGWAPIVSLVSIFVLFVPIQAALTKFTSIIRRKVGERSDKRIKLMSEIINGIQVIKMYAWEKPFEMVVKAVRAHEIIALKQALFVRSVFLGFMVFTERITLVLTCLILVFTENLITASTIYPIQQYFSIIQMNLTLLVPMAIAGLSEMLVALDRIQGFLILDERDNKDFSSSKSQVVNNMLKINSDEMKKDDNAIVAKKFSRKSSIDKSNPRASIAGDYAVEVLGASCTWNKDDENAEMTLKNISMRVRKGKLCAVVGPVGCGKSSLLQLLLKEIPVTSGNVNIQGRISYACQESWLFPATVRDNILFGSPYDAEKYKEVCRVCCLKPDFKQFPYGDLSLVGERGVSLSGGQRARINLARAVYREADIYLLDDPLSAVDANVGRQLFEGCINGYLRGRTVILVTHQIHFLKAADYLVILNEGAIENMGTYNELAQSEQNFSMLLTSLQENDSNEEQDKEKKRPSMQRGISVRSEEDPDAQNIQTLAAEERAKGNLQWGVLFKYLSSIQSWCLVVSVLGALFVAQGAATGTDYWLSLWTNQVSEYENTLAEGEEPDLSLGAQIGILTTGQYLAVYGGLITAVIILLHVRITIYVFTVVRASQNLHDTVFKNVIAAVMRFFDTNPSGRVLNRFSKDLGAMDELLPRSMLETVQMYLTMASILVLNAIALPWTLIPTFVLIVMFIILLKWYLNAAQAVKRLEGTTKSPVFGLINSTISGLSTIRSSDSAPRLLRTFDAAQDLHSSAFYTFVGGSSAFGIYLDLLCIMYLAIIFAIFILVDFGNLIPVGSVGMAVSQSMVLAMMLQMAARFTADFLGQMTAVERVLEYTKLPSEEHLLSGPTQPPKDWPPQGEVKFENVTMSYGPEDPPVLRNLNFVVKSGWKVGVVGRTGAGKSSLIAALFRLSNIDGSIKIDSVDTLGVAKQQLRSKISIIPQEPVLFNATLRYNLDPFNRHSDDDLWRALEQVELKDVVPALDYKISEGGSNFSAGQRQLLCLARAVLRSNKILVLDEATANVDPQTDALIQTTIRREFASCTVITIAHRLNTIMDSDRVLVMDKGLVVEYDHPHNLLSNPQSHLMLMVNETGENMKKSLIEVAKTKYYSNNPPPE